ncbi:MAG TPA: GNAT family N-acetyltransferase [Chitinispirillaceae bacterium]|nr:GNAT family N-acetyltransferase [Chitinispirillaceae bacterium]
MLSELSLCNIESVIALRVRIFQEIGKIKTRDEANVMIEVNRKFFLDQFTLGNLFGFMDLNDDRIISIALGLKLVFPPVSIQDQGNQAHIFNVYTVKEHRRNGKAAMLVNKLIENFKLAGVEKIILDANKDSTALYEKLGFVLKNHHMILELTENQ